MCKINKTYLQNNIKDAFFCIFLFFCLKICTFAKIFSNTKRKQQLFITKQKK